MVNIKLSTYLVPISFNRVESRFRLSANWATSSKSDEVVLDNRIRIASRSMNPVSRYKSSNLAHISEQRSRLLTWDIGSRVQVDLITPRRESVTVSH